MIASDVCVLLGRRARIAKDFGDETQWLAKLEEASRVCRNAAPLFLLEHAYRRKVIDKAQLTAVYERLMRLVERDDASVSMALFDRFIDHSETSEEDLTLL